MSISLMSMKAFDPHLRLMPVERSAVIVCSLITILLQCSHGVCTNSHSLPNPLAGYCKVLVHKFIHVCSVLHKTTKYLLN